MSVRRRRQSANVTLRDVARAAGVSTASASRALTGAQAVSEILHERVVAAAKEVGYSANPAARALASRRSGLVGVVNVGIADPVRARSLAALERVLASRGYSVILRCAEGPEQVAGAAQTLRARGVEALVFTGCDMRPPSLAGAGVADTDGRDVPRVNLDHPILGAGASAGSAPAFRRADGYLLAARYLRELGHRRIALLSSGPEGDDHGIEVAWETAGVVRIIHKIERDVWDNCAHSVGVATTEILREDAATGIICSSDIEAVGVIRTLEASGWQVPNNISVIGFGDTDLARLATPTLTSVRVPVDAAGAAIADHLIGLLAPTGGVGRHWRVPREQQAATSVPVTAPTVKLVIRGSTGPAPMKA